MFPVSHELSSPSERTKALSKHCRFKCFSDSGTQFIYALSLTTDADFHIDRPSSPREAFRLNTAEDISPDAPPVMAEEGPTLKLLRVKVLASGCIKKLKPVIEIHRTWNTDDDGITIPGSHVGLYSEYAITTLEEVLDLVGQLLRDLPSYQGYPDERRLRLLELKILSAQAKNYLHEALVLMYDIEESEGAAYEVLERKISEASSRSNDVHREAIAIEGLALELCEGVERDDISVDE